MDTTVAIFERLNIDESESEDGGGNDIIEYTCRSAVESDHAVNKGRQIFRSCTYMIGKRQTGLAIVLAHKASIFAEAKFQKTRIADNDLLQA